MEIQLWTIDRVKPYDQNPRRNDGAVAAVAASIKEFGFRQPIVVDEAGVIIVDHTRWKAARNWTSPRASRPVSVRLGFRLALSPLGEQVERPAR
jgi:hypothetical protein